MNDTFQCPKCGQRYKRRDGMAGKSVRCRSCQQVFPVPEPELEQPIILESGPTQPQPELQLGPSLPPSPQPDAAQPASFPPATPLGYGLEGALAAEQTAPAAYPAPSVPAIPGLSGGLLGSKPKRRKSGGGSGLPRIGFNLNRLNGLMIVFGIVLMVPGYHEWRLASKAKSQPARMTLAELAERGPGDNLYIELTDFELIEDQAVELVKTPKHGGPEKRVKIWFPAVPSQVAGMHGPPGPPGMSGPPGFPSNPSMPRSNSPMPSGMPGGPPGFPSNPSMPSGMSGMPGPAGFPSNPSMSSSSHSPAPSGMSGPPNMGPPNMGPSNMGPSNMGPSNMGPPNMSPPNMGPPLVGPPPGQRQGPPSDLLRPPGLPEMQPGGPPVRKVQRALPPVKVIILTFRCKTDGELQQVFNSPTLRGMVINDIQKLRDDEARLLSQGLPGGTNISTCYIFEENRTPSSSLALIGYFLGGALLILGGLAWVFKPTSD